MKKLLLVILILIIVVAGGLFALISVPKKVDVEWTKQDFDSYLEKGDINFDKESAASIDDILTGNYETVGVSEVDVFVTNEEVTAMINMTTKDTGLFQDVNMQFIGDNRMEVSAVVGDNIDTILEKYPETKKYEKYLGNIKGKSIYMKTTLENVGGKEFKAHIEDLRIGSLPLPEVEVNENGVELGTMANNILGKLDGFNVESFDITEEGIQFKGTIPKEIKSIASK